MSFSHSQFGSVGPFTLNKSEADEGGSHTSEEGGAGDASELRQTKETASDLESFFNHLLTTFFKIIHEFTDS